MRHRPRVERRARDRRGARADLRRRARPRARPTRNPVGPPDPRICGERGMARRAKGAERGIPLPDGNRPGGRTRHPRADRCGRARSRVPNALGAPGARGTAARRCLEGNGSTSTARADRRAPRALRRRRHHRSRRIRRARRPRRGCPGCRRVRRGPVGARPACRPARRRPRGLPRAAAKALGVPPTKGPGARAAGATAAARHRARSWKRLQAATGIGRAPRVARRPPCSG